MQRLSLEHSTGDHCGSTSLRNLARYYGWGFDEPACFGLGEGLGFSYLTLPERPHRAIFGRTGWLERVFFENLEIEHTIHEGEQFDAAWDAIKHCIDDGDPVLIFADIFYLDYYESDTHFAPHSLLVVGYETDADDEYVLLADSEFESIQRLPIERLENALTSDHFVPLQCRYLTIDDPALGTSFEDAATAATRETATAMLDATASERESKYFTGQGISEIEAFAAELPDWGALEDPSWTARFAYQNIERRGTGGGAFRLLYADYLGQVGAVLPLPADVPSRMESIAGDWTAVSELLYEASEAPTEESLGALLEDAAASVSDIADREQKLYEEILASFE